MTTWRVMTWNILGSKSPNLDVVSGVITGSAPDIVAMQEVQHRQARGLARRLGWRVVWARKHSPYSPAVWWRAEGLALLSPHALGEMVTATISPGVSTWTFRHRVVIAATVTRGGDSLRVANTHLSSHDADERIAQAARVVTHLGARTPAVVAGDMNTDAEEAVEVLREFRQAGLVDPGGEASGPSMAPTRRLDYVLVPEAAEVTLRITPEGGEHWSELSDHLPVIVEFEI
jgi:endonuclease/exonuclease/phosphatase family metal-dependent hydrolase